MDKQSLRLKKIRALESALLGASPKKSAKIVNKLVVLKAKAFENEP